MNALLDALLALCLAGGTLSVALPILVNLASQPAQNDAANQVAQMQVAGAQYIHANLSQIKTLKVLHPQDAALQPFLSSAFVDGNVFGQQHVLVVAPASNGGVDGMVYTYGGTAMDDLTAIRVAQSGPPDATVLLANPTCANAPCFEGAAGGITLQANSYSDPANPPTAGHIGAYIEPITASSGGSGGSGGSGSSTYLARIDDGNPADNTMTVPLTVNADSTFNGNITVNPRVNSATNSLTPGNLTLASGNLAVASGNLTVGSGSLTMGSGSLTMASGNLIVTSGAVQTNSISGAGGQVVALNGSLSVGGILNVSTINAGSQGLLLEGDINSYGAAIFNNYAGGTYGLQVPRGLTQLSGGLKTYGSISFNPADGTSAVSSNIPFNCGCIVSATGFKSTSDARLKRDIRPIEHPVDLVRRLKGHRFAWKADGHRDLGVIAQEIGTVLPEAVGSVDGHLTVNYNALIAPLIEAVKEQQKEIAALKTEVAALRRH